MRLCLLISVLALVISSFRPSDPELPLTVSRLFSDGMIMQRNTTVPVWGTASPGSFITLSLGDVQQQTTAGEDGAWQLNVGPQEAGGPHTLTIATEDETISVQDMWFGDVWVASGQSNMEWTVANAADAANEIRSANDPLIRHFKVPRSWSYATESTLAGGEWEPADSAHVGAFTAVGYYFARTLRQQADIPIGILNTSWGGSRIEAWMHPEALGRNPDAVAATLAKEKQQMDSLRTTFIETHGASETEDPGMQNGAGMWADPDLDTTEWDDIAVPGNWETGYPRLDGSAWYRTTVELSQEQIGSGTATLHLDTIDDNDMTWVNGTPVGSTNGWETARIYSMPSDLLRPGQNTITVRVQDSWGNGGITGNADSLRLETGSMSMPLAGTWKFRIGQFSLQSGNVNQLPTLLYNKMIYPLLPFPITGFLWYQGESNAGSDADAMAYADQFQSLISSWRTAWGQSDTPFLFVSLASFRAAPEEPGESQWGLLRESQAAALSLPAVGQVITTDIGEADDIHPRNKQDVGKRLALAAQHFAYGQDLVYSGPTFRDYRIENDQVIITFDHVGSGLVAHEPPLGGFAIAGSDGHFVWADSRIHNDTVFVSSPSVTNPAAVRYAWADNPDRANLYNQEGLPAAPFRTDQ